MNTVLTLHDPELAAGFKKAGIWRDETLYSLLARHAAERPGSHALRDGYRRLTWRQLLDWVDSVAEDLQEAGVRRGQRVSIWLPNRVEATVIFLACSRNGYVCNPSLHQNYTVAEIAELLERVNCAALFAQTGYGADADRADVFTAARNMPSMKRVYRLEAPGGRWSGADHDFPATAPRRPVRPAPVYNADKVVYLAFTSGTTGKPKGVMHSDNTLLANGRAMVADWNHGTGTVLLSLSPQSHHISTVALEQMLVAGCEMILNDPPAGMKPLDWIIETGATYIMGVPTHAMDILAEMRRRGLSRMGNVSVFYMAGAPIPQETARSFLSIGITPQNVYGMTENGSHQYTRPTDSVETITATCGNALHGYEVRLWNPENPDIPAVPGEVGEIGGRGGVLMLGYYDNQIATETSFNKEGWFMSGDLGRMDEHGNLAIVGRKKDLIIRGGHNIHPSRVEDLALKHPSILTAAAIPVADPRLGEKVCLVMMVEGKAPTGPEILVHLHNVGLSKFDMPEFIAVVSQFPLTASGKVLKRSLVEMVKSGAIVPEPVRFTMQMVTKEVQ